MSKSIVHFILIKIKMASNVRDQDESDDDPCRLVICEDEDSIHSGMIKKNIHI